MRYGSRLAHDCIQVENHNMALRASMMDDQHYLRDGGEPATFAPVTLRGELRTTNLRLHERMGST